MKILIAVPCMDMIPRPFVETILSMDKPEGTDIRFLPNSLVYDARNLLSLQAMEAGYDWVMWLDSDMIVPKDTLPRLLQDAEKTGTSMISGLYVQRTYPTTPVIYRRIHPPKADADGHLLKQIDPYMQYPEKELFRIAGCGFGCVLTSVPLLEEVWNTFGPAFNPLPWAGEDVSFCYRVSLLKTWERRNIWCDSSINCGHVGQFVYTDALLKKGEREVNA